jgi:Uma2 family endonuclease
MAQELLNIPHIRPSPQQVNGNAVAQQGRIQVLGIRPAPPAGDGFVAAVPELVVEVISPSDLYSKVIAKAHRWLSAGAEQVWIADPATRTIEVLARIGQSGHYREADRLSGPPALAGFASDVAEFFAD